MGSKSSSSAPPPDPRLIDAQLRSLGGVVARISQGDWLSLQVRISLESVCVIAFAFLDRAFA